MEPTSRINIDLTALDHNLNEWRRTLAAGTGICAVVKADAYGLGARQMALRLANAGIDMLAVYNVKQATELAEAGINCPVLILMPVDTINRTDVLYRSAVAGRLHLAVHNERQLDAVEKIGKSFGTTIPVHLEIDTGMSRLGMNFEEAERLMPTFNDRKYLKLAGVFTHPASADTDIFYTNRQMECLDKLIERNSAWIDPDCAIHFAGTSAALRSTAYHKSMVRLGLGLFGYAACQTRTPPMLRELPDLKPTLTWTSSIVHTIEVESRAGVGYHSSYKTTRASRLGVVPVGYADGYPTQLANKGIVRVASGGDELSIAPVRGEINMDQITIDLTDLPDATVGSPVEIIAADADAPNSLQAIAQLSSVSMYQLLCGLSPRVTRQYKQQAGANLTGTTAPLVAPIDDPTHVGKNGKSNGRSGGNSGGKSGGTSNGNAPGNARGNGIGHARVVDLRTAPNLSYDKVLKRRA